MQPLKTSRTLSVYQQGVDHSLHLLRIPCPAFGSCVLPLFFLQLPPFCRSAVDSRFPGQLPHGRPGSLALHPSCGARVHGARLRSTPFDSCGAGESGWPLFHGVHCKQNGVNSFERFGVGGSDLHHALKQTKMHQYFLPGTFVARCRRCSWYSAGTVQELLPVLFLSGTRQHPPHTRHGQGERFCLEKALVPCTGNPFPAECAAKVCFSRPLAPLRVGCRSLK